jgi:hypothetical protein
MNDHLPESWEILRQWLPDNLQERAQSSGFLQRARGIQDAELWLRIILMHVAGGLSLEQTAVRVAELGWANLSGVAIFKRLQRAEPWLEQITAWLLEQQRRLLGEVSWPKGWRIRAIDASDICEPGSTGTDWRLHYSIRLPEMTCDHFELTDAKGGEKLGRFSFEPGDLALADRGYSHRGGFAHVLRSNADVLVRWSPHLFPVLDAKGKPWEPLPWLRELKGNRACERKVWFEHGGERFELRLLALRKSRAATERAVKKARRKAKHKRGHLEEKTIELAGYILVMTSIPEEKLSCTEALELYRGRWQIELAFKRLKSLLNAGHIPKRSDASSRAWMQAKILTALLIERLLWESELISPWGYRLEG